MPAAKRDKELGSELAAMLAPTFPGMTVSVEHNERWDRLCATFRWGGFKGLLPEERFHRLVNAILAEFRESRLKGIVWLELAPGESTDDFLKLPRSEDVADKEASVYAGLRDSGFFESLEETLGNDPRKTCPGDFSRSEAVLSTKKLSAAKRRDAKLVFIRHGAYCDCQVIQSVQAVLAKVHA